MRHLSAVVAFTLVVALAVGGACSSTAEPPASDAGGAGGAGGGAGTGGAAADYGNSPCGVCAQDRCADYLGACGSDPECPAYLACVLACPVASDGPNVDATCAAQCFTGSSSEAKKASADVLACFTKGDGATACEACGNAPPPIVGGPPAEVCIPSSATGCDQCVAERCCEEEALCSANGTPCTVMTDCQTACLDNGGMDGECLATCAADNAEGLDQLGNLLACKGYWCGACDPDDACMTCWYQSCRLERYALYSDPLGFELDFCFGDCIAAHVSLDQCLDSCFQGHMDQRDLFDAFEECVVVTCQDACSSGA